MNEELALGVYRFVSIVKHSDCRKNNSRKWSRGKKDLLSYLSIFSTICLDRCYLPYFGLITRVRVFSACLDVVRIVRKKLLSRLYGTYF